MNPNISMHYNNTQKILALLLLPLFLGGCFCFGSPNCEPLTECDYYCPCKDGRTEMSNIARWDGSQWLPLGSGVNGKVNSIIADSITNELYVFGNFSNAGGVQVDGQAKWNEKSQSWSAIGTKIRYSSYDIVPDIPIVALGGKVYYYNLNPDSLTNRDGSYLDKTGLYAWDGMNWNLLLSKIQGRSENYLITVSGIIGNNIYISSLDYKGGNGWDGWNRRYYLFDIVSNLVIDSLSDNTSNPPSKYVSILSEGVFTAEKDGVYHHVNGLRKKIIEVDIVNTGYEQPHNQLTSSSKYVSYINQFANNPGDSIVALVFDIEADTSFKIPFRPTKLVRSLASKLSGHLLFIGSAFYLTSGNADVRNIGAYDLREKKWYDLAGGVCGPVNAITEMNGSMYVGGEFSTVGKK